MAPITKAVRLCFAMSSIDKNTVDAPTDVTQPPPPSRTRFELRLTFAPGGPKTTRVPVLVSTFDEYLATPTPGVAGGWSVTVEVPERKPVAMLVHSADRDPHIVRLQVWKRTSTKPALTSVRPVAFEVGRFPLGSLRRGTYVWALNEGSTSLGAGSLVVPCPQHDRRQDGAVDIGECNLLAAERQKRLDKEERRTK
jgi:hypothetical protein